jgi:hypothetical protein
VFCKKSYLKLVSGLTKNKDLFNKLVGLSLQRETDTLSNVERLVMLFCEVIAIPTQEASTM